MKPQPFYIYIMSSKSRTLYIGVTSDLRLRAYEHKTGAIPGFTSTYQVHRLVYFEETTDAYSAIAREKQLKKWIRSKKITLIETANPTWQDLSEGWF